MKKLDLYLYIVLSLVALLPFLFLHWMTQAEAQQIANYTALPFLAWVVLSAYYLVRWVMKKRPQHQNSIKTAEKLT
jgi:hypothetical protein